MTENAVGYCCQSSLIDIKGQRTWIEDYCHWERLQLAQVFADDAGAADVPLAQRPAGGLLCQDVRPGCQIIVHKLGWAFASFEDCLATLREWLPRKINLHVVKAPDRPLVFSAETVGVSTADYMAMMEKAHQAAIALSSAHRSERTRVALHERKLAGMRYTRSPGYGYKWVGRKGKQTRIPDLQEKEIIGFLRRKLCEGFSLTQLEQELLRKGIKTPDGRNWSRSRIWRATRGKLEFLKNSAGST